MLMFCCCLRQLGGSGVLRMPHDGSDPVLILSSRQRFPSLPRRSDALLRGDGSCSVLLPACWPHARRTELPGVWGEALQRLTSKSALHPVSRPAHKHARQKDRETTGLACACERKRTWGSGCRLNKPENILACLRGLRTGVQKKMKMLLLPAQAGEDPNLVARGE